MAITELERRRLHQHFEGAMGEELAATLMESLPPAGWGDVATKQDIEQLRMATKQDIEQLRVATKQDIDQLRMATKQDIEHLRVATKQDIEHLRVATKQDIDQLRVATKQDIEHLGEVVDLRLDAIESVMATKESLTATKDSLTESSLALKADLEKLVLATIENLAALRVEMHDVMRTHTITLVGFIALVVGIGPALTRLVS